MTTTPRSLLATMCAAVLLTAGAGCGTPTGDPGGGAQDAGGGSARRAQGVRFSECMRGHGVGDFPDPDAKGEYEYGVSVSPQVWAAAVAACKRLQPPGSLSSKRTAAQASDALRFARCVRAHGVKDFPDPVDGQPLIDTTHIPSSDLPGGMSILNAAVHACSARLEKALAGQ